MASVTNVFTYVLSSASLAISPSDYVTEISILVSAGTVTINGTGSFPVGGSPQPSSAMTITEGQTITLSANQDGSVLGGLTINASSGTAQLVIKR